MKHKNLWLLAAILAVFCYACVMRCNENGKDNPAALVQPDDDSRFVTLTDAVPDAILEIRYYGTYNFVGNRVDGYEQPVALLTKEAAKALRAVSDDVKKQGYRLKIYDAYRPQKGVDHFVRWAADTSDTRMKPYFYPDLDKSVLFEQEYIMAKSGHSRGSTVDLTLFDMATEKELDMGGTFDWFGPESHPDFCGNPETGEYTGGCDTETACVPDPHPRRQPRRAGRQGAGGGLCTQHPRRPARSERRCGDTAQGG